MRAQSGKDSQEDKNRRRTAGRTLLRFPSSRVYSLRTSCSRGVHVGAVVDGGVGSAIVSVMEAARLAPGAKEKSGNPNYLPPKFLGRHRELSRPINSINCLAID